MQPVHLALLALGCLCALLGVLLVLQAGRRGAASAEAGLQGQLGAATRLIGEVGRELVQVRAEAREQAERGRAAALQAQTDHMQVLQRQVVDVAAMTQAQLEEVRRAMQERLHQLSGTVGEQLGGHTKVMLEVRGQLGALAQAAQSLQEVGKDISGLQDILRAPKLRGNLGEIFLAEILRQVLPSSAYGLQYRLAAAASGPSLIVDAVIRLGERLVPIDSKFPLESFQRLLDSPDQAAGNGAGMGGASSPNAQERARRRKAFLEVVKKHIDSIADKYIRPDLGTYDFALAYLPAENVYYEAVVRDEVTDAARSVTAHAARRKVIVVSPNTFYAYLLTVAYGLKGMHIERQAEAMRGQLVAFQKKFDIFLGCFGKVGKQLDLAQRSYEEAHRRVSKLDGQMGKLTGDLPEGADDLPLPSAAAMPPASDVAAD